MKEKTKDNKSGWKKKQRTIKVDGRKEKGQLKLMKEKKDN